MADLTERLSRGEEDAFAVLYDRYGSSMYRTALTIAGAPHLAEDSVQDVFVSLFKARDRLRAVENLKAYVFSSLRRAAVRKAVKAKSRAGVDVDPDLLPDRTTEKRDDVAHALARLPSDQREVVALKIDAGLTFAEIGMAMGIPANTASSRYRYALEKLREALSRGEEASS